ncbi:MAG: O-antigen ligase family protein [Candidatus Latescibacterota bacterium]|jgi:O-antigen ligase
MPSNNFAQLRHDSRYVVFGTALLQVFLVATPIYFVPQVFWAVPALALALGFFLFSVERTLWLLLIVTIALPASLLSGLVLPGGLRLQEGFLLLACFFALIDWVYRRDLSLLHTAADRPVLCFLLVVVFSIAVGFLHGNSASVIWRDARFPLYFIAFFLVTNFVSKQSILRRYAPMLVLLGLLVALEYVLEFVGAIDLSVGDRFVRVARLQGMVLPLALLLVVSQLVFAPQRWGKPLLLALFFPIGLAFVLTVGRSMWASFAIGLFCIGYMHSRLRGGGGGRWRAVLLILMILVLLVGTVFFFQRFTGAAIGAHVFERSRSLVEYEENVHVLGRLFSYAVALESIVQHPIIGNGQGATLMLLNFDEEMLRFEWTRAWTVDNLYLTILLKMGLLGFATFFWMYIRSMRLAWRAFHDSDNADARAFCAAAFAMLAGLLALGIGNAAMINGRFALVYAALFALVAVVAKGVVEEKNDAQTR